GNTPPTVSDTGLESFSASTTNLFSSNYNNTGSPDYIHSRTYVFRFSAGTLNGTYSEVAVGWNDSSAFSRALIQTSGGSPTTISVASDEYLDVVYEIRLIHDLDDTIFGSITIGG